MVVRSHVLNSTQDQPKCLRECAELRDEKPQPPRNEHLARASCKVTAPCTCRFLSFVPVGAFISDVSSDQVSTSVGLTTEVTDQEMRHNMTNVLPSLILIWLGQVEVSISFPIDSKADIIQDRNLFWPTEGF